MSYQVFARKYRPRTFDDVLGQDHVVRTLKNAITQNRLAHAYLFVGPRGTGKTSTARIFAKALNCPGGPMVDFDPDDKLCIEIEKGIALDVREIDGASNNGVEQVRELREEVKFAPSSCKFKIYYIDEVHMLSTAAFNALLKTLEEPPDHVKFIFATTEAHKVLPTIISRCQRFDLRRIPAGVIANHLLHIAKLESVSLSEKAAYVIAKGAEGGMRDAQSMLDQLVAFCGGNIEEQDVLDIFGFTRGETVANIALRVLERDTVNSLRELHTQADGGKDLSRLLADLIQHFRTLLVHQVDAAAAEEDLSPELIEMVRAQAAISDADGLLRVMDGLAEVDARMRWASNKLLHFEIGLIQAIQTLGEVTLSEVIVALNGGTVPAVKRIAPPALAPAPAPTPKPVVATATAAAPAPQRVVETPKVSEPKPSPVAVLPKEETPIAKAPVEIIAPSPTPLAPTHTPEQATATPDEFWKQLVDRVHTERPLVSGWVELGTLLGIEGKVVKMGLPETENSARESLLRPTTKKFLEDVIAELLGGAYQLNVVLDPKLKPPTATELTFGLGFDDVPSKPVAAKEEPPMANLADFHADPLIQAAMTKFKATLVK